MKKSPTEGRKERRGKSAAQSQPAPPGVRTPRRIGRKEWIALGLILLVGLVLRIGYLTELADTPAFRYPAFDAAFHDYWARALVTGDWSPPRFHADPKIDETSFFRPPGYPYFLAGAYLVTGQSYTGARVIQMLMGLASAALAFLLARRLFGPAVGLIAAALMSCYWIFIYFEGELLAPALEVFLALAALNVLARWPAGVTWRSAALAGALVGLFALVRPNALVLVPVALAWIWWVARRRRDLRRFKTALAFFPLAVVVVVAPATIRNYAVAGEFVPITSNAGINLYIGNNDVADGFSANVPLLGQASALAGWTCFDEPAVAEAVEKLEGRPMKSSEVSGFFARKGRAWIAEHPGKALALAGKKTLYFWGPAEISNNKVIHYERMHSRVLRFLPGFPAASALALVGLALFIMEIRARRARPAQTGADARRQAIEVAVLLVGFAAVYFASHLPFFIAGRYRVPVIPVLLVFGAYGIERVRAMAAARRFSRAAIWIGAFVLVYLAAMQPLAAYEPELGMWHFDRGDAYRKQGKTELALAEFRKAVELSENPMPVALNNLGTALDQAGRGEEAVQYFERALEASPNFLDARRNLVSVLLRANRCDLALEHFDAIIRADPQDASNRFNLGVCLLRLNRTEEGIAQLVEATRLNPRHFYAQYYLARALALVGRPGDAISRFEAALEIDGNRPDARYELAVLLAEAGEKERARAHLERVLASQPDHAEARGLLDRLK